jgi:hypothetical protein
MAHNMYKTEIVIPSTQTDILPQHKLFLYEYTQVWSLLQYRELGNIEKYTKAHQNTKNN